MCSAIEMIVWLQDNMSTISGYHCNCSLGFQEHLIRGRFSKTPFPGYFGPCPPSRGLEKLVSIQGQSVAQRYHQGGKKNKPVFSSVVDDGMDPDNSKDENNEEESKKDENGGVCLRFLSFCFPLFI